MDDMKIGGMHGELGLDVRGWFDGFEEAREALAAFAKEVSSQFKELETTVRNVGLGLTAAISVPFAGMVAVSGRGAAGFEAAMNKVQAALNGVDAQQLAALAKQARALGPEVGRSAVEAAQGIETLGLAGMSAQDILDGGLASAMKLAAANAADLDAAGALVTDVMSQFALTVTDLPDVVNKVTGSLDSSKLGFNDFKDAIAQAGGVAGKSGVSFDDFNTAIAATSTLFGSGSDAGTSFKTFLTSLTPKSEDAARVMEKLQLRFYDAGGGMKDLADIAQQLQDKLGNLSDRSRTEALDAMFGSDAMRTAIGLMQQGRKGFEDLQKTIARSDAGEKLAIQMQGQEAAANRLSTALEGLKIALGDTGILGALTWVTDALARVTNWMAGLPPVVHQIAVGLWAMNAAIGPMLIGLVAIAKPAAAFLILRGNIGLVGTVIAGLINPVGALASMFVRLAINLTGATSALSLFATAMARVLGPLGLAVTVLGVLYAIMSSNVSATEEGRAAADKLSKATDAYTKAAQAAAIATGKARDNALQAAAAKRAEAEAAIRAGEAYVTEARKKLAAERARVATQLGAPGTVTNVVGRLARGVAKLVGGTKDQKLDADIKLNEERLKEQKRQFAEAEVIINAAMAIPSTVPIDMNFDKPEKEKKPKGPSAEELANRREQMRLEQQMAVARARDDKDEIRRIQDKMDLFQRQRDYEDAGLDVSAARLAAEKDIAEVKAAEAEFDAREVARAENALDQQLAEIRGDETMARVAADKAYLEERTAFWQGKGLTLLLAQQRAAEDLVQVDIARADAAAKLAQAQALDRDAELSRLRSDTAAQQRAATRAAELLRRSEQYYRDGEGKVSEDEARERAARELDAEELARQQGQWRDTIRGGMRAALDGDIGNFVSNWWKDNVARGMEEALNSLSDMLFNLFRQAMGQSGSTGGGGVLGSILGGIGSIFGGGNPLAGSISTANANVASMASALAIPRNLPGFATGGSFEIGGKPGIDTNLVQFWGTAGETVNVKRGNAANDGGGNVYHITGNVLTPEMWAQIQMMDNVSSAQAVGTTERRASRRARRRMGK